MGSNICMNEACRATTSSHWRKGWSLKSGGFAILCYKCGSAYENSVFCETFHSQESGWRECSVCRKRLHCGCIVSRDFHEYMDFGGVGCISCAKRLETHSAQSMQILGDFFNGTAVTNGIRDVKPIVNENQINDSLGGLLRLAKAMETNVVSSGLDQLKMDNPKILKTGDHSKRFSNLSQPCSSPAFDNMKPKQGVKDTNESLHQPPQNFSLTSSLPPFPGRNNVEGTEQNKGSFQRDQVSKNILPKPPKPLPAAGLEANNNKSLSQVRVARPPPVEGKGRNQLLPRYWPKITDEELHQLSVELKSKILPLFEKTLSASDAGRIGRLVLPKACAEAYFPTINQSEGIPIRIRDIKGKEWTFQFRFWPNNNSRMYVLEGVTPCIQNMQLEATDIVTFSRMDPSGQLVVGGRKANGDVQESLTLSIANGDATGETSFSGVSDNNYNTITNGGRASDDSSMQRDMSFTEKKKLRNIKNKRLLMNIDEAMELQITWEEAQDLFRPSPTSEPTHFMVENHEFEEFEEPPIFGKKTMFTSRPSGEQEQLAQCDSCSKWRRLPVDALLSAKWVCSENIWDPRRSSCSTPEDRDLESFFSINKDSKKPRFSDNKTSNEGEPTGLDALASAAVLGDNMVELGESSVGATTRHPRHRPGCSCIVCIQPPSGKGKHEPSCKCNVCLTVKRRFKTLMMRKKKRQSEREAELALGKEKVPEDIGSSQALVIVNPPEDEINNNVSTPIPINIEEPSNEGQLDLNCDPHKEDELLATAAGMSLTSLMNAATLPLSMYLRPCITSGNAVNNEENSVVVHQGGGLICGDVEKENDRGNG